MSNEIKEKEYTIGELAEHFKKNTETIRRWIKNGRIRYIKKEGPNGLQYFFTEEMIKEFEDKKTVVVINANSKNKDRELAQPNVLMENISERIIDEVNNRIEEKFNELEDRITERDKELIENLKLLQQKNEEYINNRDQRLMEAIRNIQKRNDERIMQLEEAEKKGFFKKLFKR